MADDNTSDVKQEKNIGHRWQPGETGNPNGRPKKGNTLTDAMHEYLDGVNEKTGNIRKQEFVEKVATLAYKGDATAMKLVWNYLEGMPMQKSDITSNGETLKGLLLDIPNASTDRTS